MTAPPVEAPALVPDLWDLGADPRRLFAAAASWRDLGTAATRVRAEVGLRALAVHGGRWTGVAADAYWSHVVRVDALLAAQADRAVAVADVLDAAGQDLGATQEALDAQLTWLGQQLTVRRPAPGLLALSVPAGEDPERATFALLVTRTVAIDTRAALDARLAGTATALAAAEAAMRDTGRRAAAERTGTATAVPLALVGDLGTGATARPEAPAPLVDGDRVTVVGSDGADSVVVTRTPQAVEVTVDGRTYRYGPDARVTVATGDGDDDVTVVGGGDVTVLGGDGADELRGQPLAAAPSGTPPIEPPAGALPAGALPAGALPARAASAAAEAAGPRFLVGGAGDDVLAGSAGADRLSGGDGGDYLEGRFGDDRLDGGAGDDTQYGGSGRDTLSGGSQQDHLDGGGADDRVDGGRGNDVLSGGVGGDTVDGGRGNDVLYAGAGQDRLTGGRGRDRGYVQPGEDTTDTDVTEAVPIGPGPGSAIRIVGSPEFVDRVRSDLDTLRSSPAGRAMLLALEPRPQLVTVPVVSGKRIVFVTVRRPPAGGPSLIVEELPGDDEQNSYANPELPPRVRYQAEPIEGLQPPVAVLFHELAHVYDFTHGTTEPGPYAGADRADADAGVPRSERQAVGLPIDDETDPGGAEAVDLDHPLVYSENGLREEMGLERRPHYADGAGM